MPLPNGNLLFGFEPKLTDEQRIYVDSIFDNQLTIVNAKAGTDKTTLAVACAAVIGKPLTYIYLRLLPSVRWASVPARNRKKRRNTSSR